MTKKKVIHYVCVYIKFTNFIAYEYYFLKELYELQQLEKLALHATIHFIFVVIGNYCFNRCKNMEPGAFTKYFTAKCLTEMDTLAGDYYEKMD